MNDKQARIGWIDEFKGFVLLLVCLFHVEQSFANIQMGMLHLAALRMSAFFFISGMLFSTRRFTDFRSYFIHKSKVLLFPYVALSLLFLALDPVLYHFEWFPRAPRMVIMNVRPVIDSVSGYIGWNLAKIFVVGKSSIGSGPLWFVFTLYSVSLIFYGVQKLATKIFRCEGKNSNHAGLNGKGINGAGLNCAGARVNDAGLNGAGLNCAGAGLNGAGARVFIALVAIAALAGGWILYRNHIRLPLGIERDLTTLFFFACGWLCKEPVQKISAWCFAGHPRQGIPESSGHVSSAGATLSQNFGRAFLMAGVAVIAFVLYAFVEKPDPNFSIMNNDLGKSLFTFLASSLFGIAGLVATFLAVSCIPDSLGFRKTPLRACLATFKGILRNISRNALVILAVHWWILLVLRITFKQELDKPGIAYLSMLIVVAGVVGAIPLFRCELYKLLGKPKAGVKESLDIRA